MATPDAMRSYVAEYWRRRGWQHERINQMPDKQVTAIYKRILAQPDLVSYLARLKSKACQCGRAKRRGHAFCFECYRALPGDLQRALYLKIGRGYETAYDQAERHLTRMRPDLYPGG